MGQVVATRDCTTTAAGGLTGVSVSSGDVYEVVEIQSTGQKTYYTCKDHHGIEFCLDSDQCREIGGAAMACETVDGNEAAADGGAPIITHRVFKNMYLPLNVTAINKRAAEAAMITGKGGVVYVAVTLACAGAEAEGRGLHEREVSRLARTYGCSKDEWNGTIEVLEEEEMMTWITDELGERCLFTPDSFEWFQYAQEASAKGKKAAKSRWGDAQKKAADNDAA